MNIKGCFALSKAGHDKGSIYVVLNESDGYVFLSDGKYKLIDNPKKKKIKHIEILENSDRDLSEKINNNIEVKNEEIKRSIKCYKRDIYK